MSESPASAESAAPTRVRYKVMAFLCALSFLTYYDRMCIVYAQDSIRGDLGLSLEQMGWVLSAFWLAYAIFEIPGGWLGERFGSRIALARIVIAWSLFTCLSGSAVGFLSLLTMRILFGAGEAGAYPNMARVQGNWLPAKSRARAGGLLWLMVRWGAAFSPIIYSQLVSAFDSEIFGDGLRWLGLERLAGVASWRLSFWASGLFGAVWVAAFYPWFRDDPAEKKGVNQAELELIRRDQPAASESHSVSREVWKKLFTSPSLWAMAVLYLCGSFGWSFFASWMPEYLKKGHNIDFKSSAWLSALPYLCGGASCLVGGTLCDLLVKRTGRKRLVRAAFPVLGLTTAATAMFFLPSVTTTTQAVVLMCLANAAHDFGQGANWATIVDIGGKHAGVAAGFNNTIGNMGNTLQPVIGAKIIEKFGWTTLFTVYACAFFLAASMWLFINPNRTFYENADEA